MSLTPQSRLESLPPFDFDRAPDAEPLRESFKENGFFVLRRVMDLSKLEHLRATLQQLFALQAREGEDIHATCARLGTQEKAVLYRIFLCAARAVVLDSIKFDCLRWAELLYPGHAYISPDSCVLFALPNDQRLAYDWHQEISYTPGLKNLVNFWYPVFEAATRPNGTMSILAGSHKYGPLPYTDHKPAPDAYNSRVPNNIQELTRVHSEYHCEVEVGDIVLFHPAAVHRSNPNRTAHTRFTGSFRIMGVEEIPEKLTFA